MAPHTDFWHEKLTIGDYQVPRFMAAPLDGVTDSPLRTLIREFSPDVLLFTEMRHVACVVHEKTGKSLLYNPLEHPLCYQIAANRIEFIDEALEKIARHNFRMINLNLGCPARCVTKSGGGSALMANILQLTAIMDRLQKATAGKLILTVKIRAGYKERNAVEVAKLCEDYGAQAIIIHPRTAPEGFTSRLDFESAARVKKTVKVPVIFSGNITNFARAEKTYELTGVDGFMIGRALWGCPWKIKEITEQAAGRDFTLTPCDALVYALKHLRLNFAFYDQHVGMNMFKKQLPQYIRGVTNAVDMRRELLTLRSSDEMEKRLEMLITLHQ